MELTGKKRTRKFRYNAVDFLIIIVIIACVVGIALRYDLAGKIITDNVQDTAVVTFLVENVKEPIAQSFIAGDKVYWMQNGVELGAITDVTVSNAKMYFRTEQGEMVQGYAGSRFDVVFTVSSLGKMTDNGYMVAGTQYVGAGKAMKLQTSHVEFIATIIDVKQTN